MATASVRPGALRSAHRPGVVHLSLTVTAAAAAEGGGMNGPDPVLVLTPLRPDEVWAADTERARVQRLLYAREGGDEGQRAAHRKHLWSFLAEADIFHAPVDVQPSDLDRLVVAAGGTLCAARAHCDVVNQWHLDLDAFERLTLLVHHSRVNSLATQVRRITAPPHRRTATPPLCQPANRPGAPLK